MDVNGCTLDNGRKLAPPSPVTDCSDFPSLAPRANFSPSTRPASPSPTVCPPSEGLLDIEAFYVTCRRPEGSETETVNVHCLSVRFGVVFGKRARCLVGLAWGASSAMSVPAVFLSREALVRGRLQCWIELELWQWQLYMTLVACSLFFVPALVITACYSVIVYTIWTKSKILSYPKLPSAKTGSNNHKTGEPDSDTKRTSSRGVIPKAKIKTIKMTLIIVFVFILCWSPYFVYDLLQVYGYTSQTQTAIAVSTFVQSLAPLNSVANPVIYCLFSTNLCRNLRSVGLCNCLAERLCGWWPSTPRRSWREQTVSRPSECSTMTESLQQQQRSSTRLQLRQHRRGTLLRSTDSTDAHVRNSHV
ncbi:cardioacceleratory peptide receptor isoform X2 [Ixodes scapularis]